MGGVVSSGQNNDELIDNLMVAEYIKTPLIERVFRAVDRGEYFLPEVRNTAYKDLAWKSGNLHLSAPCIYTEVMEGLCLESGQSFLNIGSGTGYLSTMVGLILGSNGVNHGVEFHEDVLEYANKRLENFKKYSGAVDEFDFCEPKFILGNGLCLNNDGILYDRVYCGAACPEQFESYMRNLLKVGGVLVMPLNEKLVQIKRSSETSWKMRLLLSVTFATLIHPPDHNRHYVKMLKLNPPRLQIICRSKIRKILRDVTEFERPELVTKKVKLVTKAPKKKRQLRKLVVPLFESEDSSDEDVRICRGRSVYDDVVPVQRDIFNFVLDTPELRNFFRHPPHTPDDIVENKTDTMDTDTNDSNDESERAPKINTEVKVEVHQGQNSSQSNDQNDAEDEQEDDDDDDSGECICHLQQDQPSSSLGEPSKQVTPKTKREKIDSGIGDEIVESYEVDGVEVSLKNECGRRISTSYSTEISSEEEPEKKKPGTVALVYNSPYTQIIKSKIQELPLPPILKSFLNYHRDN